MHFLSECEKTKKVKLHFKYLGTLSACLFSLTLFLSLSLLTAITCDPTLLFHDCNYMSTISIWSPIVAIGVLLATFRWVLSTPLVSNWARSELTQAHLWLSKLGVDTRNTSSYILRRPQNFAKSSPIIWLAVPKIYKERIDRDTSYTM